MATLSGPFTQIITMAGMPLKGSLRSEDLEIHQNAGISFENGRILAIGPWDELIRQHSKAQIEEIDGPAVLLPGFIDSHTHLCWAGSRAGDMAMRLEGKTYLEIAEAGGGIWSSVQHCRQAERVELVDGMVQRARHLLTGGVTTIEVKSGYGLSADSELHLLECIAEASNQLPMELVPTCLAAHMKPHDFSGNEKDYLDLLHSHLLPVIMKRGLANRIDIFIEKTAFGTADALVYLEQAKRLGFTLTVHGDQFSVGGSRVAIDAGAASVDHLEVSTDQEIRALADSDVVATVLPGASLGLGTAFAPARKLLDAGCCLAIASDWNPGSAPMGELLTQAAILAAYEKLSMAEVLAGLTYRAAAALKLNDRGCLNRGMKADLQAYPIEDYREIIYNQGRLRPSMVWIDGKRAV